MSSGHQSVPAHPHGSPESAAHEQLLTHLLDDPRFAAAVKAYTKEDETHDIPFLAGSNNAGDTIFYDRSFVAAIKAGKVKYDGRPYDPRPFIKVHEAVEGVAIRLLHANYDTDNAQGLPGGHLIATWAERRAVEHAGLDWDKYQASLKSWIKDDEHEKVSNPPPDLLTKAYQGTPQAREVANTPPAFQGAPGRRSSEPSGPEAPPEVGWAGQGQQAAQKLSHEDVDYGPGHADGDHCAICIHYLGRNDCELVVPPIQPMGWCKKFKAKGNSAMISPQQRAAVAESDRERGTADPRQHALSIASATHLHSAGHISGAQRDEIHGKSRAGLAQGKIKKMVRPMAFGSLAPPTRDDEGKV